MRPSRSVLALALVCGALVGVALTASLRRQSTSSAVEVVPAALPVSVPATAVPVAGGTALPDFAGLARALSPSVVNIATESEEANRLPRRHGFSDPFGDYFRGPRRSLGSGFVFDADGYIITNHHVVEDATKIVVKLSDGTELEAEHVGSDSKTDLAVIKVEANDALRPAPLGDSDDVEVGQWVLTIGNPFGLDNSVTAGIISAKGRQINRRNPYDDFLQTDAAINPGNSGGPLVNLSGQVIGINTAIFSSGGGNIGIGFAIPVNMARTIVPQLKEHGHVTRGWLGVKIQPVDEDIARSLSLPAARGALVAEVFPDSPAAAARIKIGDVLISFDGIDIEKSADLPAIVADTPVGKKVEVRLVRDGREKSVNVRVAKLDDGSDEARPVKADAFGLSVQDLTPDLATELDLDEDASGVVVAAVNSDSPAELAGIRPGDVIEMVGNSQVTDADGFREMLAGLDPGERFLVLVRRGDQTLFRVIKPTED